MNSGDEATTITLCVLAVCFTICWVFYCWAMTYEGKGGDDK